MAANRQRSQTPQTQANMPGKQPAPASRKHSRSGSISQIPNTQPTPERRLSAGPLPSGSRRGSMANEGPFGDWIYLGVNYDSEWDGWDDGHRSLSGWNVRDDKNTHSLVKKDDLNSGIVPDTVRRGELLFRNRTDGKVYTESAAFPNFRYKGRCISQQDFGVYKELVLVSAYKRNPANGKLGDPNFKLGKPMTGCPIEKTYHMGGSETRRANGTRKVRDGSYALMTVGADVWQDIGTKEFWVAALPSMQPQAINNTAPSQSVNLLLSEGLRKLPYILAETLSSYTPMI